MAGDENKRSEARTAPEVGNEGPASGGEEPSSGVSQDPEGPAPSEPAAAAPAEEPAAAEEYETAEPPPQHVEAVAPAPIEEAAVGADPVAASDSSAAPRARTPFLPRLIPYLVVFAIGALVSIGAGFILSLLSGPSEDRGEIEQRLAALNERAAALELKHELDSRTLGGLTEKLDAAETHARQALTAVNEVEKALAARPSPAASDRARTSSEPGSLGPLAARLEAIEQKLEQKREEARAAIGSGAATGAATDMARVQATAIVAGRLVQEVERGDAYLHEIDALVSLGVEESALAPLRASADTGVASVHRLSEDFARLAPAILASERKAGDASLAERLKDYAANLVQIERMDEHDSKEVRGLVSRIKLALAHDHVADAYALWSELPDAAKAASESFGTSAKNRLETLDAARSIEAGAVAALSKPKS